METLNTLTTTNQLRTYFKSILEEKRSGEEYPVELEMIYPIIYVRKDHAVRDLKKNFIEGVDYQLLPKNEEQDSEGNKHGGNNKVGYNLSVPCLEYFVARKVRPVFDVYREVFHQTIEQKFNMPQSFSEALRLAADQQEQIEAQANKLEIQSKKIKEDEPKVTYFEKVLHSEYGITMTEIGQSIDMSAIRINRILKKENVQKRQGGKWMLCTPFMGNGYTVMKNYMVDGNGSVNANHMLWTEKGKHFVINKVKEHLSKQNSDIQLTMF